MKKVIVLGTSICVPCKRANVLMEAYKKDYDPDVEYKMYKIDLGDITKEEAFSIAGGEFTNVPVVVVDGVNIGGFSQLQSLVKETISGLSKS